MTRADTADQLAEYLRIHPDTSAIKAVGHVGADPSQWVDPVRDALDADTPHAALATPAEEDGRTDPDGTDTDTPETTDGAEEDPAPDRPTPGVDAERSPPTPEESGDDPPAAARSGRTFYPSTIRDDREWWVDWVLALPLDDDGAIEADGTPTKQPIAPYRRGDATPVRWNFGLDDDEHPSTSFDTVARWNDRRIGVDLHAPERVISDTVGLGIIIPPNQDGRTITLLDWDDVRDPETEEIHPVAADALDAIDGYAEVSQSGKGIHQFVFGEIPGGLKKFIRHVDDEPFIGDDRPQIEMYQSGRLCAMTGEHVDGAGDDIVDGQDLIDRLCWEYGTASNTATDTPSDPFARDRTDTDTDDATPSHAAVGDAIRESREYDGPAVEEWDTPDDRTVEYDAVLRARERSDELAGTANWELIGYAAGLGYRDGLDKETVLADLQEHPTPQYGYDDTRARKEVRAVYRKAENGNYHPPTAARLAERGILPEDAVDTGEPTALLPPSVRDLATAASGWDWRHAAEEHELTKEDVQDRTADTITEAFQRGEDVLTIALPASGKTYGALLAAARTGKPTTVLAGRGRKEQYDQLAEWCEEHGLTYKILPSFTEDCPTAAGDHGEEWSETVDKWYRAGATPKQIHMYAEETLGRPLPCQIDDGGNHVGCPYKHKWDFDPETDGSADPEEEEPIDVLIGHYTHAYREEKVVHGRTVAIDEHPGGAYQSELGINLQGAVSYWLETVDAIPFESYTDLVENRSDESRRADALLWFDEHGIERDGKHVFGGEGSTHADAPLAVFTLLTTEDLGNGWHRADLDEHGIGLFTDGRDYRDGRARVFTLSPPDFQYANAVVALDGTPTKDMWELSLDTRLSSRPVLDDDERADYIRTALNLNIVRTSDYVKTYNNPDYVNTEEDAALLEAIAEEYGTRPSVISTMTAIDEYDAAGVLQYVDETKHYGNVLGSNTFGETRLGAVIGSQHYGDGFVKRWGAYANVAVESPDRSDPENRGTGLSYGPFGDKILQHMREHDTLQSVMRFGRDGNGAVVYVHTNTLPDWVPLAGEGGVIRTKSDGERRVVDAVEELGSATTATIAEHADLSRRQTFDHLERLREEGYLAREQDPDDGRAVRWVDDDLHRTNEHGEVQLDGVDFDDLTEEEVAEVARSSIYTWDLRNSTPDHAGGGGATPAEEGHADDRARTDGGRPPDPPS